MRKYFWVNNLKVLHRILPAGNILGMELRSYINLLSPVEQTAFADSIGSSIGYLRKAISIGQTIGPDLALAIERETNGAVTIADLRPAFAESLSAAGYVKQPTPQEAA
jgi:DNA-binding transcriptional regulator YdaS (Cro superfamily)